ncbi:MAG: hypothetical protein QNJ22_17070 [Desulfosarcinaceae bacterium]|nr:hypothetical protein [Desulfosarcinaceae bacterium]
MDRKAVNGRKLMAPLRIRPLWWLAQTGLVLMAALFLIFGVQLLIAAYGLPDPFTFIMTFFAASLVILISMALLVGFLVRIWSVYRRLTPPRPPDAISRSEVNSRTGSSGDDGTPAESPAQRRH